MAGTYDTAEKRIVDGVELVSLEPLVGGNRYWITSSGHVFSCIDGRYNRIVGSVGSRQKQKQVSLKRATLLTGAFISTLVLDTFVGPRTGFQIAEHINGDGLDNRLENLRWSARNRKDYDIRENVTPQEVGLSSEGVTYAEISGHPGYWVGTDGTVWSSKNNKWGMYQKAHLLKQGTNKAGYKTVMFSSGKYGTFSCHRVHSLVLKTHGPPKPPEATDTRHKDGTKDNNHLANLEWGTRSENNLDMRRHGTSPQGEKHPSSKATTASVLEMRRRYDSGENIASIARDFCEMSKSAVYYIATRRNWKHV